MGINAQNASKLLRSRREIPIVHRFRGLLQIRAQLNICRVRGRGVNWRCGLRLRAHGEPGQYGELSEPDSADRTSALAGNASGLHGDRAPTPEWNLESQLWAALPRSLRRAGRSDP